MLGVAEVKYDALVESSKNILNITRDRSEEDLIEVDDVKEFKEHTVLYKLSPAKHTNVEYFRENVQSKFSAYVKNLEEQDAERALYTMESAPGEKVV